MIDSEHHDTLKPVQDIDVTAADGDRRELLRHLGRFAYAAPALALLAQPKGAQADYGGGSGGGGDGHRRRRGPNHGRSVKRFRDRGAPKKKFRDPGGPARNQ